MSFPEMNSYPLDFSNQNIVENTAVLDLSTKNGTRNNYQHRHPSLGGVSMFSPGRVPDVGYPLILTPPNEKASPTFRDRVASTESASSCHSSQCMDFRDPLGKPQQLGYSSNIFHTHAYPDNQYIHHKKRKLSEYENSQLFNLNHQPSVQTVCNTKDKKTRPFKAYSKDLKTLSTGIPSIDAEFSKDSSEKYAIFRKQMLEQIKAANGGSATVSNPKMRRSISSTNNDHSDEMGGRKDVSYAERRLKNNLAAKKSRDRRRIKEDEIAIRAAFLEAENLELKCEVAALRAHHSTCVIQIPK